MTIKFQRNYRCTITVNGQQVVIQPPLTIEFSVNRSAGAQLNTLDLKIYNLNPDNRNKIFSDWYNPTYSPITLEVGYDDLSVIFKGSVYIANSYRQGPNVITYINSRDGGFDTVTARSNFTINPETSKPLSVEDLFARLINDFPNVTVGKIGTFDQKLTRGVSINGNTWEQIKKYSGGQCFIDLEKAYILNPNENVESGFTKITADTGLLSTPRRAGNFVEATMLLEPRIIMYQQLELEGKTATNYNGKYTVQGVSHNGTISEAVGGTCSTTVQLLNDQTFGPSEVV